MESRTRRCLEKMRVILRHDDFDFRMNFGDYIDNHEKFIKNDLIETAVVQYTHDGIIKNFQPELIKYIKESSHWDIQLHGWAHDDYSKLTKWRIREDIDRSIEKSIEIFGIRPTVWYPPWNCFSEHMSEVAIETGLKIDNESYDISRFIREVRAGTYMGHSVYFHLWSGSERDKIDEMLECAKSLL